MSPSFALIQGSLITQKVRVNPRTSSGSDGIRTRDLGLDRAAC